MRLGDRRYWPLAVVILLLLPACDKQPTPTDSTAVDPQGLAAGRERQDEEDDRKAPRVPFDDAEVFFEFNTTANDLGLQIFLDAAGWKRVTVSDPRRHDIVQIVANGPLARLGITELRFESAEPSPAEVLAMFRPGDYRFRGRTVAGEVLVSEATLSHDFLPAPTFAPANGQVVNPANTVVTWTAQGADRVEVIIEHATLGHVLDVIVPGSVAQLSLPPQFLAPNAEYKIEILLIAENGNRTIAESTFRTGAVP